MATGSIDPQALVRLTQTVYPVCELGEAPRRQLAQQAQLDVLKPKTRVAATEDSQWLTFLVRGEVTLVSDKGETEVITGGSPRSRLPLFKLHLEGVYAQAKQPSVLVRFNRSLYHRLATLEQKAAHEDEGEIVMSGQGHPDDDSPLYTRIYHAFQKDEIALPTLPDIALRIREAIRDPGIGVKDVAKMVLADPVLSARLIHVANSAAYRRDKPVTTVYQAATRLGLEAAQNIALSLAMKHLFQAESPLLKQRMQELYEHSSRVASLSYVIARHSHGFNGERALLAGLLHDIGIIPILTFADRHKTLSHNAAELDKTIQRLRGLSGHLVLSKLGFEQDLIDAAENAENWLRDDHATADYGDVIVVAQLHSYLGTPHMQHLPRIDQTPAYRKLDLGEFDPVQGLAILREAHSVTSAIHQLLH